MKALCLLFAILSLPACVTKRFVTFEVVSDPPGGYVDVDDLTQCGATPCKIELFCKVKRGQTVTPMYRVTVFPPSGSGLFAQTKVIDPCKSMTDQGMIRVDHRLDRVKPMERIEITER